MNPTHRQALAQLLTVSRLDEITPALRLACGAAGVPIPAPLSPLAVQEAQAKARELLAEGEEDVEEEWETDEESDE